MIIPKLVEFFGKAGYTVDITNFAPTPSSDLGDIGCNIAFMLAKKQKKSPMIVAEEIKDKLQSYTEKEPLIERLEIAKGRINLFFNKSEYCHEIMNYLTPLIEKGLVIGSSQRVMVEYFQPNTHKAIHVGHLRNGVLGAAISRILAFSGYEVITSTYMGDTGAHVAKWLWYFNNFVEDKTIPQIDVTAWSAAIYTAASRAASEKPQAKMEIDELQSKLESGDEELVALWKQTRDACLKDFEYIMKELDIHINKFYFESDVEKKGKTLVQTLLDEGIARMDNGAPIIDMESHGIDLPNVLLMKSDGSSLYSTKELALSFEKEKDFDFDISLFVISSEQQLYLKQLFATLKLAGYSKKNFHVNYNIVKLEGGKMSSRKGNVVFYTELRDKMLEKAREEVEARNPDLPAETREKIARQIVFGAMKFSMLSSGNSRNIIFNWEKSMRFEGKTGAYIQYSVVRARKILDKCREQGITVEDMDEVDFSVITAPGYELFKKMADFEEKTVISAKNYDPSPLALYTFELAQQFSLFYTDKNILNEPDSKVQQALIATVRMFCYVIEKCLQLLGIETPALM
ncbi:MAG: arginine--tRNA ligase [Candidatus Odinarchaeota archaeon]